MTMTGTMDGTQRSRLSVTRELTMLGLKERAVSRRRRELHEQIDRLYLSAPLDDSKTAQLDQLETLEGAVSRQRRMLHEQIDELRAQIGLPRWREAREFDSVA